MIEKLDKLTYEVRHNPNCPSPFLIVTCGSGGRIGNDGNLFAYGRTLNQAVDAALLALDAHENHRHRLARLRLVLEEERRVRGIVWA